MMNLIISSKMLNTSIKLRRCLRCKKEELVSYLVCIELKVLDQSIYRFSFRFSFPSSISTRVLCYSLTLCEYSKLLSSKKITSV